MHYEINLPKVLSSNQEIEMGKMFSRIALTNQQKKPFNFQNLLSYSWFIPVHLFKTQLILIQ